MDYFMWSTSILAVWAAVGPLVGIRYGQELARRFQKTQWVIDNKKAEYRELLGSMANTQRLIWEAGITGSSKVSPEQLAIFWKIHAETSRTIQDRIFIEKVVQDLRVLTAWTDIMLKLDETRKVVDFLNEVTMLRDAIMKAARQDLGIEKENQTPASIDIIK